MTHAPYTVGMTLPVHTLRAHNDAVASANKIHDDAVAVQYGFRGGLVPGVSVYAYMTYPLVQQLGDAWLTRGTAQVRFARPLYEGDEVTVRGTVRALSEAALELDIRGTNATGIDCGIGTAALPAGAAMAPAVDEVRAGPSDGRQIPVSWEAVVVGDVLPRLSLTVGQSANEDYCRTHGDDLPVYSGASAYVHPGMLLHQCNRIFAERFALGPWIHVASEITTYRPCRVGEALEVRGVPAEKFAKKGHEFVVLDVRILAGGAVAQRVKHTCIFRPRKG